MISREEGERKRITSLSRRPKKYNYFDLLLGEYTETCFANVVMLSIVAGTLWIISGFLLDPEIVLGGKIFLVIFFLSLQMICCAMGRSLMWNHRENKNSDWYSAEKAQALLNSLENQKHTYTQRIVVKRRRADSGPDQTVLDESEEIEYEDCFNISPKVDLGGEEWQGVTKIYISNVAERGDAITDEIFKQKKQEFIDQRKGRGDYHEYSAKFHHPQTPDFIFVSKGKSDGSPDLPCYHKKVWKTIFRYLWLGSCWEAFVESCLSTAVVFYNQEVISVEKIEEELKQSIKNIREENRLKL